MAGRAEWVRNLMADPRLEVWHGWHRRCGVARLLAQCEASEMILYFYRRRPACVRMVCRLLGEDIRSEADVRRLAIGLQPIELILRRPR
jgi:hypothetical protein